MDCHHQINISSSLWIWHLLQFNLSIHQTLKQNLETIQALQYATTAFIYSSREHTGPISLADKLLFPHQLIHCSLTYAKFYFPYQKWWVRGKSHFCFGKCKTTNAVNSLLLKSQLAQLSDCGRNSVF